MIFLKLREYLEFDFKSIPNTFQNLYSWRSWPLRNASNLFLPEKSHSSFFIPILHTGMLAKIFLIKHISLPEFTFPKLVFYIPIMSRFFVFQILRITFPYFHLEDDNNRCSINFLQIHDGNSVSGSMLGKFCGVTVPNELFSSHNTLYIWLNGKFNAGGFQMNWESRKPGGHHSLFKNET